MPHASAMTFLTAPPSSQPTTSVFVYGRKYGGEQASCTHSARSSSVQAITVAVGCLRAISRARFGPETTTIRSARRAGDLGDDLAHPLGGAELDALHQADEHGVGRQQLAPLDEVRAKRLRRDGERDQLGAGERGDRVVGRVTVARQHDARQVLGIRAR